MAAGSAEDLIVTVRVCCWFLGAGDAAFTGKLQPQLLLAGLTGRVPLR